MSIYQFRGAVASFCWVHAISSVAISSFLFSFTLITAIMINLYIYARAVLNTHATIVRDMYVWVESRFHFVVFIFSLIRFMFYEFQLICLRTRSLNFLRFIALATFRHTRKDGRWSMRFAQNFLFQTFLKYQNICKYKPRFYFKFFHRVNTNCFCCESLFIYISNLEFGFQLPVYCDSVLSYYVLIFPLISVQEWKLNRMYCCLP